MSARGGEAFRRASAALGAARGLVAVPRLGWHGTPNVETARASGGEAFAWPPPPPVTVAGLTSAARASGLDAVTVEVSGCTRTARVVVPAEQSNGARELLRRFGLVDVTAKVTTQRAGGLHAVYGCLPEVMR